MDMDQTATRLLFVAQDENDYAMASDLLSEKDGWKFQLEWMRHSEAALETMMQNLHDVCVLGSSIAIQEGLEITRAAMAKGCQVPIILIIPEGDAQLGAQAVEAGAADCLVKGELTAPLVVRSIRYATAIKRAQEDLAKAREQIRHHKAEVSALLQGAHGVMVGLEFKDAAQAILDSCKHFVGASGGCITLQTENGKDHEVIVSSPEGFPGQVELPASLFGDAEDAASAGGARYRNDSPSSHERGLVAGLDGGLHSILWAPLVIESKRVGLLLLVNKPEGFDDYDARTASAFGELAAVALHHSQTLDSLEISVEFFRSVLQTANDGIISADSSGKVIFWNHAAERIFGYSADEIVGKSLTLIIPERFRKSHMEGTRKFVASGTSHLMGKPVEVVGLRKDGSEFPIELSIATWKTREGTLFTGVNRDITDRKEAEEALTRAKEEAEVANCAKSEFLANMSHEIRTPLNAIIGTADLLWETQLSSEQQQYVKLFRSAGDTLLNLINDILDLSKVEAGHQLRLENTDIDLRQIVERTCEVMALRAHEKGVELACHVMPDVPDRLLGDSLRLRQIVANLLGNAIKFTPKGEVVVRVERSREGAAGPGHDEEGARCVELVFSVADTGLGIPLEKRNVIFESFTQGHAGVNTSVGGTGLGLSISKHLVELMGGRIWVESEVGQGSTFCFTASFQIPAKRMETPHLSPLDLRGMRALVVDDNATNRMIVREMLSTWGVEVNEAQNGAEALGRMRSAKEADMHYQLVLLDCRMPGMGGFQVAGYIQEDLSLAGATIMMLTSDHRKNDIDLCRKLGISGYLVKPIIRSDLQNAIAAAMGGAGGVSSAASPPKSEPPAIPADRELKILLVEDSLDNRLLIQVFLKKTPFQVHTAEDGAVALEKFRNGHYDLVLMDMQMPVMDGYEATQAIREWERNNGREATPIIALTAYAFKEDARKSLDAGCTAHVTKPITKAALIEAIQRYARDPVAPNPLESQEGDGAMATATP